MVLDGYFEAQDERHVDLGVLWTMLRNGSKGVCSVIFQ